MIKIKSHTCKKFEVYISEDFQIISIRATDSPTT